MVGQNRRPGSVRAIISRVEQPAEHRVQPHHLEIRSADDARTDFARLAEPGHGEPNGGEVTERAQCLDAFLQIVNLRHRERNVVGANAVRALADVDQPVLVAVDKRPQEHTAHHTEDGRISADAERQGEHHGKRKPFRARQRSHCEFHVVPEGQNVLDHRDCSFDSAAKYIARAAQLPLRDGASC